MYLVLGALVFVQIEKPAEKDSCQKAKGGLANDLYDYGNRYFYDLGTGTTFFNSHNGGVNAFCFETRVFFQNSIIDVKMKFMIITKK